MTSEPGKPTELGSHESRYELEELLGRGAMGQVYKAFDHNLGRHVALKFLNEHDPREIARVRREARAMARVDHHHVCKLYEAGHLNGRPFISMQYVEGLTLSQAGELTLEQKVMVIRDVALAVHEAHRMGIIHRDIKPSNIMIDVSDDGEIKTFVMDFGVAREVAAPAATETNLFTGTPLYMAPEQAKGEQNLDRRTDIYSIGATMYELFSGRPPLMGSSSVQVILKLVNDEPVPLKQRVPNFPRDLDTITMKCLAKESDQRYDSAKALAHDLQRFLDGDPIEAHPPSLVYRVTTRLRKHKTLSLVVAFAVLTAIGLSVWAIRERQMANYQAQLAQEFTRQAQAIENNIRLEYTLPRHDLTPAYQAAKQAITEIHRRVDAIGPLAMGPGYDAIGRALIALTDFDRAHDYLEKAVEAGYEHPQLHAALGQVKMQLYQQREQEARVSLSDQAYVEREITELQNTLWHPARAQLAQAGSMLGDNLYVQALLALMDGDPPRARHLATRYSAKYPWLAEGYVLIAHSLESEAEQLERRGDYAGAADYYRRAEQELTRALVNARSHPLLYQSLSKIKLTHFEMLAAHVSGDHQDFFNELMAIFDRSAELEPNEASIFVGKSWAQHEYAAVRMESGSDAMDLLQKSIDVARTAHALNPDDPLALNALAVSLRMHGYYGSLGGADPTEDYLEAIKLLERAVEQHPSDTTTLNGLGLAYQYLATEQTKTGQNPLPALRKSITYLERGIEVSSEFAYGLNNVAGSYFELAYYQIERGEDPIKALDRARQHLLRAIELNPNYYNAYYNLAWSYFMEGYEANRRGEESRDTLEQAVMYAGKAIELNPETMRAYSVLAGAYAFLAEAELLEASDPIPALVHARTNYRKVLELSPQSFVYNDLANTYLTEGTHHLRRGTDASEALNEAIALLDQAIELNENSSLPYINRGYAHRDLYINAIAQGRPTQDFVQQARQSFETGLSINPAYVNGYVGRAGLFRAMLEEQVTDCRANQALIDKAQADLDKALEINATHAEGLKCKAELLLIAARQADCQGAEGVDELLDSASQAIHEAVESKQGVPVILAARAEVRLWQLRLGQDPAITTADALKDIKAARQGSEFQLHLDLLEAQLLSERQPSAKDLERARELASRVAQSRTAFAPKAKALLQHLNALGKDGS